MPLLDDVTTLLRLRLGDALIGLPAQAVREIVRAVAITPLPGAPAIIEGVVNVRGAVVPVIDIRRRLSLAERPLDPEQYLVVLEAGNRTVAIRVDDVDDLVDVDAADVGISATLSPTLERMSGLAARPDGVLVIYDPAAFVTQAEAEAMDAAIAAES